MQVRCGAPVSGVSPLDTTDHAMRALARRAVGAVGHGDEARRERRQALDRAPQRGLHRGIRRAGRTRTTRFQRRAAHARSVLARVHLERRSCDGCDHVLAVGLERAQSLAQQPRLAQHPPQPRQRVLDHALPRVLERLVALKQPQPPVRSQRRAHRAAARRRARPPARPARSRKMRSNGPPARPRSSGATPARTARLEHPAGEAAALDISARGVCGAARGRQRDAGARDRGRRFQQFRVGDARDQGTSRPSAGAPATDQLPERAPEARLADQGRPWARLRTARRGAVGQQQRIATIQLREQSRARSSPPADPRPRGTAPTGPDDAAR